jgi:flagellar biosynthesis/type III secretory pathway protein FliH
VANGKPAKRNLSPKLTPEEVRERQRKYYAENKERYKEYGKKYYVENKDMFKEYHKKWVEENKERLKETRQKWTDKNRERINALSNAYAKKCFYKTPKKQDALGTKKRRV